jgi:hypothetical protein
VVFRCLSLLFTTTSLLLTAIICDQYIANCLPMYFLPTVGLFSFKILLEAWLINACTVLYLAILRRRIIRGFNSYCRQRHSARLFTSENRLCVRPSMKRVHLFTGLMTIRQELLLLILLKLRYQTNGFYRHFDNFSGRLWIAILSVQAVPYVAALLTANQHSAKYGSNKSALAQSWIMKTKILKA